MSWFKKRLPEPQVERLIICQKHQSYPFYFQHGLQHSGPFCMPCLLELVNERIVQNNPQTPRLGPETLDG
jgi:hypothetical protein